MELIIKNISLPPGLRTHQPDTKMVEIPFTRTVKQRLSIGIVALFLSGISVAGLMWVGSWYRATIHDWDYCIQNDLCFVCHQPAPPTDFASDDFRANVRLCPQHSTGWQAWRWVVYGVPAEMLIYQDAPMGTGKFFQPLLRWVICGFWFFGLVICAVASIVSLLQLGIPKVEFFPWLDLREYSIR